jgi:hypothetical protein
MLPVFRPFSFGEASLAACCSDFKVTGWIDAFYPAGPRSQGRGVPEKRGIRIIDEGPLKSFSIFEPSPCPQIRSGISRAGVSLGGGSQEVVQGT